MRICGCGAGSRAALFLSASVAVLCHASPLSAQAVRNFALASTVSGDDGITSPQTLGFGITVGSVSTSTIRVDLNGHLSFDRPFTRLGSPGLATEEFPVIAGYFADIFPYNSGMLTFGQTNLNGRAAFAATWDGVPRCCTTSGPFSTFQIVIVDRSDRNPGDFDVELNYNSVGGLTYARAGIAEGITDPSNAYEFPGSGTDQINDGGTEALVDDSNVGLNGRYLFQIINGQIFLGTLEISSLLNGGTPNQNATAAYIDKFAAQGVNAEILNLITALATLPPGALPGALDLLQPEHYIAQVNDTLLSSKFFLNGLMSCPTTGEGTYAVIMEDQCVWAKAGGRWYDQDRTFTNIGGDTEAWNFAAGGQVSLGGNLRLGAGASYEQVNLSTTNAAHSDGDRAQAGIVLKDRWGPTSIAAAAFGGQGWFDTTRSIGISGIGSATGKQDIKFGGGQVRLSYLEPGQGWYLKPMVDLNATYIEYGGFSESGAGVASLNVRSNEDWVVSASPAVELGSSWSVAGAVVRPFVRAGITTTNDSNFMLTSSFAGAPAGVTPFSVVSEFDDLYVDLAGGVDVISVDGIEIKVNYDGRYSDESDMHAGGAKVGVQF